MDAFDDKLNQLLSNPEAMDQIMKMAQSLMGSSVPAAEEAGTGSTSPPPDPTGGGGNTGTAPFPGYGGFPGSNAPWAGQIPFGQNGNGPQSRYTPPASGSAPDLSFLSGLGSIDPKTISSLLPILRELSSTQNSNARQLLFALRPYLKPERQNKVERALQLARLFRVGKKFLLKGDGHV